MQLPTMKEQLVVGIVQPALRAPAESPLDATIRVARMMRDAVANTKAPVSSLPSSSETSLIDLFVLPEMCPVGYSEDTFARFLPSTSEIQALYHQIDDEMKNTATACQCYVCYGTIGWNRTTDDTNFDYFIRQKVVNSEGTMVACYDNIYLCDYGDCNETRFFTPGQTICTFECHGWRLGLMICADIRYARLSRQVVLNGYYNDIERRPNDLPSSVLSTCQVILQPSCFSRDLSFRTWKSFRETRAVENSVYWIGSNYSGTSYKVVLEKRAVEWARNEMPYYRYLIQDRFYSKELS